MLSRPDADLVRRDPALPGLATVLNAEAFADALQESLPADEVGAVRPTTLRYAHGRKCVAGFRVELNGETVEAYGKALAATYMPRTPAARLRSITPGRRPRTFPLPDGVSVASLFPYDERLPALTRLTGTPDHTGLLPEMVPDAPELWDVPVQPLHYDPERRFAGTVGVRGPSAVLRLYGRGAYETARIGATEIPSGGPMRLPRVLGTSDSHRALLVEWLRGRPLAEMLALGEDATVVVEACGAALAELHTRDARDLQLIPRAREAGEIRAVAADIASIQPRLETLAINLGCRLAAQVLESRTLFSATHGDFRAEQILLLEDGPAFVDLDRSRRGDPATDLGNFVAHLDYDVLRGRLEPSAVAETSEALLEGYRRASGRPLPPRIELYAAVGLLRLATAAFRRREADWADMLEGVLLLAARRLWAAESSRIRPRSPVEYILGVP